MRLFTIVFERLPMVWLLLGLLFMAAGLYLGFDNRLSFVYMFVGMFCCAYAIALFAFQFGAKKKSSAATRLSPNFISAGSTVAARADDPQRPSRRPEAE